MRFLLGGMIIIYCFFCIANLNSMEEMDAKALETLPFYETVADRLKRMIEPFESEEDAAQWASAVARFKAEPTWLSSIKIDPLYNKMLRFSYKKIIVTFFDKETTERLQQVFELFDLMKQFEFDLELVGRMPRTYEVPSLFRWVGHFEGLLGTFFQKDFDVALKKKDFAKSRRALDLYICWKRWLSGRGCAARVFAVGWVKEADGSFVYIDGERGAKRKMTLLDFYIQKSVEMEFRLLKALIFGYLRL
jgi:hypothetical protein